MTTAPTHGHCDPRFRAVADVFARNFRDEQEIGASFCVFQKGEKVVDLWGGHADKTRTRPWEKDTLVNVWSSTKGMMALCVARLVDQNRLSYEDPVAKYWPEFGVKGKDKITVAQLFSHQAGVCGTSREISDAELLDTDTIGSILAAEAPQWPIGTRSGYHALSIGPLGDSLFKRAVGKTVGQYFRDEIGGPADVDFHIGLPLSEEGRVAETSHDGQPQSGGPAVFNEFQMMAQVNIPVRYELANMRAWRTQGTPSAGGQGNARGLASVYSALATDRTLNGVELVSRATLDRALTMQIENEDLVLRFPIAWGIGFALNKPMQVYGPNPQAFGHHGWGGSFGFADPGAGLGVAYAMNFMREPGNAPDPRFAGLVDAVYASV